MASPWRYQRSMTKEVHLPLEVPLPLVLPVGPEQSNMLYNNIYFFFNLACWDSSKSRSLPGSQSISIEASLVSLQSTAYPCTICQATCLMIYFALIMMRVDLTIQLPTMSFFKKISPAVLRPWFGAPTKLHQYRHRWSWLCRHIWAQLFPMPCTEDHPKKSFGISVAHDVDFFDVCFGLYFSHPVSLSVLAFHVRQHSEARYTAKQRMRPPSKLAHTWQTVQTPYP